MSAQLAERRVVVPTAEAVNEALDGILRSSGSALKYFTLPGTLKTMRDRMREAMTRAVGPDEVVVKREEWEVLNDAVNHAREYIRSDRQEKREWKGWTLDEFDVACERIDALREPTETKEA